MKYNLTDKKLVDEGTLKDTIIEKHGYVPTFTLAQLEENTEYLKKHIKEVKAKRDYEQAKVTNVEAHHPMVKDIPEMDRFVIHMYQEASSFVKAANRKLEELETQLAEDESEIKEVLEQIPELANIPSPFVPDAPAEETKVEDQPVEENSNDEKAEEPAGE